MLYNLACAWMQLGEPEKAKSALCEALELASVAKRRQLFKLAAEDPSFVTLRATRKKKKEFGQAAGRGQVRTRRGLKAGPP